MCQSRYAAEHVTPWQSRGGDGMPGAWAARLVRRWTHSASSARLPVVNADLHRFVHDALARGVPRETIRSALREARWPDDEIDAELAAWHDVGIGLPVPRRRIGISAREAFLHLLLFVSLYLVAYHAGAILFGWFERLWPDRASLDTIADPRRDTIRLSVASLLVAFPIYLFTARLIGRAVARDPEKRNSGVRRWLTYLTLFNAACVLIGDLIAILLGLLKGELTQRFVSKAAVVGSIAGWLFTHYLRALRRDEVEPPTTPAARTWPARAAGTAVVLVLALGLWLVGTPAQVRRQALDQRRIEDLQSLSQEVNAFEAAQHRLPATTDELREWNPGRSPLHWRDPVRRTLYAYRSLDAGRFALCATFDAADSVAPYGGGVDDFWRHGAGPVCFKFRATQSEPR